MIGSNPKSQGHRDLNCQSKKGRNRPPGCCACGRARS